MTKDTIEEIGENSDHNFTIPNVNERIETNDKSFNSEYEQKQNKILIFGIGGGGSNTVEKIYKNNLQGVEFLIANTDFKDLKNKTVPYILIGKNTTAGNGAGRDPEIGRKAAEESIEEIREKLTGISLVFLVTYLGGGTGTGATPVIARLAKEMGILVIAMVTKPPKVEGEVIMRYAIEGINELKKDTGTLIVIPMDNLDRVVNSNTTMIEAHEKIIDFISMSIKSITDLITPTSEKGYYIGLDLADVKTNMKNIGKTMMGFGEAEGENRAIEAVEEAIHNPLLDNVSIRGTTSIIVNITTSEDTGYFEVMNCREKILEEVDNPKALIIAGHILDSNMGNKLRVSIFATGIGADDEEEITNPATKENVGTNNITIGINEGYIYRNDSNLNGTNRNNNYNNFNNSGQHYPPDPDIIINNYYGNRTRTNKQIREKIGSKFDNETTTQQKGNNIPEQQTKMSGKGIYDQEKLIETISIEDQYKDELKKWGENKKNNGYYENNLYGNNAYIGSSIYSDGQLIRQREEAKKNFYTLQQNREENKKKKKGGFFFNLFGANKKEEEIDDDESRFSRLKDDYKDFSEDIE